jgi:adenylosuccinate lyase
MEAVRRGADRQEVHERLRVHARAAAERRASRGEAPDLLDRIAADPAFRISRAELAEAARPERLIGRAAEQVEIFVREELDPALEHLVAAEPAPLKV